MRNMGPTYSAYGQAAVKIPEDYFISSKALEGLTLPQASQRVAQFKNWRTENRQRMASKAILNSPELQNNRTILPNGTAAVYMPDLGENPKFMEMVIDVGCDGGWCTKEKAHALDFGSGNKELHLIVNPEGRPMAQLTLEHKGGKPGTAYGNMEMAGRFEEYLDKNPEKSVAFYAKARAKGAAVSDQYIVNTPEFKEYIRMYPSKVSISEIKSVGNREELRDNPAISDIQKYIQYIDADFNLDGIVGLNYTGLTELAPQLVMSGANKLASDRMFKMTKEGSSLGDYSDFSTMRATAAQDLRRKIIQDNAGSKYFTTDEDGIRKIIQDAIGDLGGDAPQQRATGGMVQGYAEGGIADLPKGYDEEDFTTLKPFLPTTTSTANNAGIATIVPGYGNPNAAAMTAAAFDSMTPAQKVTHQKILQAINDARPMAFTIAEAIKNQFFPVTSTAGIGIGIGDGGDGPSGSVTVGALSPSHGDGSAPAGIGNGSGVGTGASPGAAAALGTGPGGMAAGASSGGGYATGGMIERQFIDNRRYM